MAKRATPKATPPSHRTPDPVKVWNERLARADKQYDKWVKEYEVERLGKYYLGRQWRGLAEADAERKYTINLVFATVETQLPSLMFSRPKITVEPRPGRADEPGSDVAGRATLIESTLQTFVDDPKLHFKFQTTLALRDTYARFGLVEVGYTADWIDNPHAGKPVLKDDETPLPGTAQPAKLLKQGSETLFVKRLPPQSFRISPGRNGLEENDWAAYYEWHRVEDVKRNPDYQHTAELKATGQLSHTEEQTSDPDREQHAGMVKLWKIWDFRQKVRHVLADGHPKLLQEGKPYSHFPIAAVKLYEIADSWYPLPPLYNWMSPQDEINEIREMRRVHRRRFTRRYMREPSVTQPEFEKLETGEDGVCIEVAKVFPSPIAPIPDAPLDPGNMDKDLAESKSDFIEITGASGEARGVPQAETATQANIINIRQQIRESSARVLVADWLADIVRLMLLTIREKMQLPFMVQMHTDPFAVNPASIARTAKTWQEVGVSDVDDIDVDVKIDIASLSPVSEDAQRAAWNVVLTLLTNPALLNLLMQGNPEAPTEPSPLLRKTLALNGVKSDQEVREIWRVGQAAVQQMMLQQMAEVAMKGGVGMPPMPGGGGITPPGAGGTASPVGAPAPGPTMPS